MSKFSRSAPNLWDLDSVALLSLVLVAFYVACGVFGGGAEIDLINWVGPASLAVGCIWAAVRLISANRMLVFTPVPWFLAAVAVYFGVGPLAYTFGDSAAVDLMNAFWPVDANSLWKTNLLNAVGVFVVVVVFQCVARLAESHMSEASLEELIAAKGDASAKMALTVFLAIGLPTRYALTLPYELGLTSIVLPGSITALGSFVLLSILLLGYLSAREGGAWSWGFAALLACEIGVGILQFNKSAVLIAAIMGALGRYLALRKISNLAVPMLVCGIGFAILVPFVAQSRGEVDRDKGATLEERLAIARRGIGREAENQSENKQGWWTRLCYTNAQAFAIYRYDRGEPGDSLSYVVYTVIPRALWPDKPVITDVGVDYTELVVGHRLSSTGIGIFGEAYWNGGWLGVLAACAYMGVLYAWLTRFGLGVFIRHEWLLLPCILWGIRMGFRIDGWFIADYVGSMVIFLAYLGLVSLVGNSSRQVRVRHDAFVKA